MASDRNRLISGFFLVMLLCVAGVVYVATFHVEDLQRMIRDRVARSLGEHVVIESMQVGFFPYPYVELMGVGLIAPGQGTPIFQASQIRMDLSFLSLLQERPMPKTLVVDQAFLNLSRNAEGQWNYRHLFQREAGNQTGIGVWLWGRSLKLSNGSVRLEDRYQRESALIIQADKVELQVERLVLDGPTEMFFSAQLRDTGSVLSSSGTLRNIGGWIGSTVDSHAAPQLDLHARMDLDRKGLLQLADLIGVREVPVGWQGRTKAQGQVHFAPGLEGYDLSVSDLVVLTDSIDLNAQVSVTGLWRRSPPTFFGQWTSAPVAIQHVPQLFPAGFVSSELHDAIHRETIRGKIQTVAATFTGSTRKEIGYALTGKFQFSEGIVRLGPGRRTLDEVACAIHVQPDQIRLSDFRGQYEDVPLTRGEGTIVFAEQEPWMMAEVGGNVSSRKMIGLMQRILEWDPSPDSAQSLNGTAGSGLLTLRFAGPLKNPQAVTFRSAEYHPERITVQLPGVRGPLTQVEGLIAFSPERLRFENVRGLYGQSDFHVEGKLKFAEQVSLEDVWIQGRFSDSDLFRLFADQAPSAQKFISGKADYRVSVNGKLHDQTVQGRVALQGLEIHVPGILNKRAPLAGYLDFHVHADKGHRLQFHRVALTLPSVRLTGHGEWHFHRTSTFNASLSAEPIRFESLPPGLEFFEKTISSGTLKGLVKLRGRGNDWKTWDKSGWVTLTSGVIHVESLGSPISDVTLQVKMSGHGAELKQLRWNFEGSRAQATGIIRTWDSQPKVNVALVSPQFNVDLLLPGEQPSLVREFLEKIAQTAEVSGKLRFDRVLYRNVTIQQLTGQVQIKNGVILVEHIRGRAGKGTIQGLLSVHLPVRQPATVKTWFKIDSLPMVTLQRTFFDEATLKKDKRVVTGLLSAEGALQGHGRDPRGVLPTLKGTLKFSIVDGRIKRGIVISKILALMNLPGMLQGTVDLEKDGYPFDQQAGTVVIADGRIVSKDIVMDGPILKMTAAGQYDLVNDDLDVVTVASPLGPYFELLQKIPIFHLLLEGEERGIDLAMFSVKGSLHAPTIELMAVESVASEVTGFARLALSILKNTLTLPQKILFPEQESEDTSVDSY